MQSWIVLFSDRGVLSSRDLLNLAIVLFRLKKNHSLSERLLGGDLFASTFLPNKTPKKSSANGIEDVQRAHKLSSDRRFVERVSRNKVLRL